MKTDPRKQSMYLERNVIQEMRAEAERQERSLSWLVQKAWNLAKQDLKKYRPRKPPWLENG